MKKIYMLIVLFFLTGCWNMQGWKYTSEPQTSSKVKVEKTVIVTPFRDTRINNNNTDYEMIALIPFVPYSRHCQLNTPDGFPLVMSNMGPANEALAKATAEEVNNASVFKNTYFDFNGQKGDYVLKGTLKEFKVEQYWTFYGLSFFGEALWLAGLPIGKEYNGITIQYQLSDKNGHELFNKEYTAKDEWEFGLYRDLENYRFEKLMKQINMDLVRDLKANVAKFK